MKSRMFLLGCLLLLSVATAAPAAAARYALLVGVGQYRYMPQHNLQGPAHDVAALKGALTAAWGFRAPDIVTLVNSRASKKNILKAIAALIKKSRAGDFVFVYFSGHGTSSYDKGNRMLGLDPLTGALVPADFKRGAIDQMLAGLIIGNRDLRPLFLELEQGPEVLVVFDSCYSGNTARGLALEPRARGPVYRRLDLQWRSAGPGLAGSLTDDEPAAYEEGVAKEPPYPYRKLVYMAASSKREEAADIPDWMVANGKPTIDGKPHGAMTDALLKALAGQADGNRDGRISIAETYQYVREEVSRRFNQTPRLLFNPGNARALGNPLFGVAGRGRPVRISEPRLALRVRLQGVDPAIERRIAAISGLAVADGEADLWIIKDSQGYRIFLGNGFPLSSQPLNGQPALVGFLERQVAVKRLASLAYARQPFNLFFDLIGGGGVLTEGEKIGFKVRPEKAGFLLLIDIDSAGRVFVIYPADKTELAPLAAGKELRLPGIGQVRPPNFGTEFLKAFVFAEKPAGLERLAGGEFWPHEPLFDVLMKMVQGSPRVAQSTLRVKTAARDDLVSKGRQ